MKILVLLFVGMAYAFLAESHQGDQGRKMDDGRADRKLSEKSDLQFL